MAITNITEAKAQLSALIERVLEGEEIIIGKAGKPVARLVPFERPLRPRQPGALVGRIVIAEDFDELPEDLQRSFGMVDP
jgi:prevent-host-death family protein